MSGEIRHKWNGTVLTITSDSGTSSADLKGRCGGIGPRGPQGRCGVIVKEDGSIDYGGYATEEYVDYAIESLDLEASVDLSNYYTKDEIDATLAEFQPSGGGGGGSGNNATISLQNSSGWINKTISEGASCYIQALWNSVENGMPTGDGAITITVGGVIKYSANVPQGSIQVNVAPYLALGKNSVRLSVMDVYGNTRSIIYNITLVALTLTSTFNANVAYTSSISYTYVATGSATKTMYFILDGEQIGTETVSTSGRQKTFTIPAQAHGSHTFEVYFTCVIDGMTVESNHLFYDLICLEDGNETPIISSTFNRTTVEQFETLSIYYTVYHPTVLTSDVVLAANGMQVNALTVDRTQQLWAYRPEEAGNLTLTITSGSAVKTFVLTVAASEIDIEATTEDLTLHLSSYGRSNAEANPASWIYEDIECEFSNYNWKSDGWLVDADGWNIHRITGDARLTIPLKIFNRDARETGKTIEIEFATSDVMDYDTVIATCMSGNVGFELTAQKATLRGEQSSISTQYKENEHMRLTFVIEKRAENRLIYTYLDGIMCGAVQYPDSDNFSQSTPVNLVLGSNLATMDIYNIRVYDNGLTRYQVLDNWIADTQDIELRLERYSRNSIYNAYGAVVVENLPTNLPYMILEAAALPTYKGNKVSVDGSYVDPMNASKSFTFVDAEADVQGTSSAGYARKNYKIGFPETYQLREDSIPTDTFTFKADVASSEGANNVELVRLYNAICPYKTPPQLLNPAVRQGIDGFPMVIFHNNGDTTSFIGKYNFNNDKATPEVFGFASGDESWEIRNNTSNRVIFKSADYEGTDWLNDFEGRYPDGYDNPERLAAFAAWVVSTDRTGLDATTAQARLEKFRNELADWAEVDSAIFYYLFTELFLMVDSRAKNAFPTWYGENGKVCWLPYDMDTALGINNEGALAFGYELEDIDTLPGGADVYNGQQSVFWCNLRDAFGAEIKAMYQQLRSDNLLSYQIVEDAFEAHQIVWPEAIWNEDAWYKYLQPLVEDGTGAYLAMLQGSKSGQRKWWLYNRFRYLDAKYNAGDAETDFITLRGYEKDDITIEPYADIYATIKYGSYLVQQRALRGSTYTLECPMDNLNDTEIYIYSSSQLKSVGDLSGLKVGYADFSMATKLQTLKLGEANSSYSNGNLTELYLGNNTLLHTLDVRNCPMLGSGAKQQAVDLSGCRSIEYVYFDGTTIKGCSLPNGGVLKVLHLPSTITNLTIMNQPALEELVVPSYANLTSLRLENTSSAVDIDTILNSIAPGSRVRLIGNTWNFDTATEVEAFYDVLDTMKGLDENDGNMDKAQVSGYIHLPTITSRELESLQARYPSITITYDSIGYVITYVNYNNVELYSYVAAAGSATINPVALGYINAPTKPATDANTFTFGSWSNMTSSVQNEMTLMATYTSAVRYYTVNFYNGSELLESHSVAYGSGVAYTGTKPDDGVSGTTYAGFFPNPIDIRGNMNCYAIYYTSSDASNVIYDSWEEVVASINDGSYVSKYPLYSYKYIGTVPYVLEFNTNLDDTYLLPNGGRAAVRFEPFGSTYVNPSATFTYGQWDADSTVSGGWADSDIRKIMNNDILADFPQVLQDNIKAVVNKQEYSADTVDKLWAPNGKAYLNRCSDAGYWVRDMANSAGSSVYYVQNGNISGQASRKTNVPTAVKAYAPCFCL